MAKKTVPWPFALLIFVLTVGGVAMAPQGVTGSNEREADFWAEAAGSTGHINATGTTEATHATEITTHTTEPPKNTTEYNATTEVPAHSSTENGSPTTEPPTTAHVTTPSNETSTEGPTTQPYHQSTETTLPASSSTTTTTEKPAGRKFDVASFFGGMAAAVGITVIIFLIVRCYSLRGKTRYNAM